MSDLISNPAQAAVSAVLYGHAVIATAPLGTLLRFSDGEPRPPERFRRKLSAWKNRNGTGRLVEKSAACTLGDRPFPATFTLHLANYGSNGTIVMVVNRGFQATTDLRFEVLERPASGMVRVLSRRGGRVELHRLTSDMAEAEAWMAKNRYCDPIAEIVGEDEAGAAPVGRAA